jgi:hypothetical protein
MFENDRTKLIKLLNMFSSDFDGEVCTAARMARALIRSRQLDWDDLIISPGRGNGSAELDDEEAADFVPVELDVIRHCIRRGALLLRWEREFLGSIAQSVVEWGRLTPKQRSVLDRIVGKLQANGAWGAPQSWQ